MILQIKDKKDNRTPKKQASPTEWHRLKHIIFSSWIEMWDYLMFLCFSLQTSWIRIRTEIWIWDRWVQSECWHSGHTLQSSAYHHTGPAAAEQSHLSIRIPTMAKKKSRVRGMGFPSCFFVQVIRQSLIRLEFSNSNTDACNTNAKVW